MDVLRLFQEAPPLRPDQLNEHQQVMDESVLRRNRIKFGVGTVLYQSEEVGLGAVSTVIIRSLDGQSQHIGIYGAVYGVVSFFQWVGTLLLRAFGSNRKAIIFAMGAGATIALLLMGSILLSHRASLKPVALWGYLILALLFAAVGSVQSNIESSWIGVVVFAFFFAQICDRWPGPSTYTAIYLVFALSFVVAGALYSTATDRVPKNANFVGVGG